MVNSGYVDYTRNFLRAINFDFNITIYCLDKEAFNALDGEPHGTCVDASVFMKTEYSQKLCIWATPEYKKILSAKLDSIKYTLEHSVCPVGYIDMDIVVFTDPTPILLQCMKDNPSTQMFTQCDEITSECTNFHKCKSMCSGVIVFRNNDICKHLLSHTEADIARYQSDQDLIMHKCDMLGIGRMSVSNRIFINGAYPHLRDYKVSFPSTACLVHFNHTIDRNGEKRKAMMLQDLWRI